jgi:hypothetical protein
MHLFGPEDGAAGISGLGVYHGCGHVSFEEFRGQEVSCTDGLGTLENRATLSLKVRPLS